MSATAITQPLAERLSPRQRWLLLGTLMVTMFMGALDQTIMATATPRIVADLGGFELLSWVFTSYMLSSTMVVPLVGKLSDIYGRKVFLMAGIVLFLLASAGCGAAPSMLVLVAFRTLQGIGGGMLFSSVFTTVADMFSPAERGKYTGLFTGTFSLASVLGPTVGGLLTDHADWRWVFYINIPVGMIALPAIWFNLPLQRNLRRPRIDFAGALWLSVATGALLLGLAWSAEEYGWTSPITVGLFATGILGTAAFVRQELRHPEPILPLHLFRNREFLIGNLLVLTLAVGIMGMVPYLPTFVQLAMDASATASGLVTTPQSVGVFITSVIGGQLVSRTGRYRVMSACGAGTVFVATAAMLTLGPSDPPWHLSVLMVVLGLGVGFAMPTMSVVIPNAVPHEFLGVAMSSRQFFMQLGGVLGAAVFGIVLTTSFQAGFKDDIRPETQAVLSPAAVEQFSDPTLTLDKAAFAKVKEEVLAGPNGAAVLADAERAQKDAITTSMHYIFFASLGLLAVTVTLALLLQELPLRSTTRAPAAGGAPRRHTSVSTVDLH